MAELSRPHWPAVGPDFAERMEPIAPAAATVVRVDFAAATEASDAPEEPAGQRGTWRAVRARLRAADPAAFANWYAQLSFLGHDGDEVRLAAATPFVGRYVETHLARSLSTAIEAELGPFERLRIESG